MGRLARRLLFAFTTMISCGLLGAMSAGCVIPTTLSEQPPVIPIRPAIDASSCVPAFGTVAEAPGQLYALSIKAEDADPNVHELFMQLFLGTIDKATGKLTLSVVSTQVETLTAGDPTQPQKYSGAFDRINLCSPGLFHDGDFVYVVVSDTVFSSDPQNPIPSSALTDQNYWVLSCM